MANCNNSFSSSYLLLKPEEVGFLGLFRILCSSDIEKRKFVDSSTAREESFQQRWIILISIVAQKFLPFISKPLAGMGWLIEMWLNLPRSNLRLCVLPAQSCTRSSDPTGRVKLPDRKGETFLSFVGNLDTRVDLDSGMKHEDGSKYYAALSMMASKTAYENEAFIQKTVAQHWKMEYLGFYDYWNDYQEKATTQAFLFEDKDGDHNTVIVSFRGTEAFDADACCSDVDQSRCELSRIGRIHGGFMKALGLQKNVGWPEDPVPNDKRKASLAYYHIRERLKERLSRNDQTKFVLTGHSLGFPAVLAFHEEKMLLERLEGIYTFGQPRVGNEQFGQFMENMLKENGIRYFRFVYGNDIVPRLPYDDKNFMFKHFGTCLYFNRHYEGKVVDEVSNENYFSPFRTIPKIINAFMELIRSFTISSSKGPDYKEGSFLIIIRLMGLPMPGVPAHFPQDYVNSTPLGSSGIFFHPNPHYNKVTFFFKIAPYVGHCN